MRLGAVVFISLVISTAERRSIWLDLVSVVQKGHCKMHQEAMKSLERSDSSCKWVMTTSLGADVHLIWCFDELVPKRQALETWRGGGAFLVERCLRRLGNWEHWEVGGAVQESAWFSVCHVYYIIEMIVQNLTDQALLAHSWWSDAWFFLSNVSPVIGHPWRRQSCRPSMAGEERVENLWLGDVDSN